MLGSSARNVLRRQLLSHEILIMMLSLLLSRSPNYAVFLDYTEICWWIRGFDLWPLRSKRDLFLQAFESRFTIGGSYCTVTVRRNAKTTRRLQPVDMCGGRRPIARLASSCRHRRLFTRTTGPSPSPSAVLALHGRVTRTAACLPLRCRAGARAESDRARGGGALPHAAMRRRHWHGTPTEPTGRRPAAGRAAPAAGRTCVHSARAGEAWRDVVLRLASSRTYAATATTAISVALCTYSYWTLDRARYAAVFVPPGPRDGRLAGRKSN